MQPPHRAAKVLRCAQIAIDYADGELLETLGSLDSKARRTLLKRFPGIADPGVAKVLLFCGLASGPAIDSNGLRVLERLGFVEEGLPYAAGFRCRRYLSAGTRRRQRSASSRSVRAAAASRPRTLQAHADPDCESCPLRIGFVRTLQSGREATGRQRRALAEDDACHMCARHPASGRLCGVPTTPLADRSCVAIVAPRRDTGRRQNVVSPPPRGAPFPQPALPALRLAVHGHGCVYVRRAVQRPFRRRTPSRPAPALVRFQGGRLPAVGSIVLAPGVYQVTIVARDGSSGKNVLSETNAPAVVRAGVDNTLRFTMYAVPTRPRACSSMGTGSSAASTISASPLSFSVYIYGVTENGHVQIITGAGTPQLVASQVSGSLDIGLTQPSGQPATFTVSAPGGTNLGLATVRVSASFPAADQDRVSSARRCELHVAAVELQSAGARSRLLRRGPATLRNRGRRTVKDDRLRNVRLYRLRFRRAERHLRGNGQFRFGVYASVFRFAGDDHRVESTVRWQIAASNDGKLFVANASATPAVGHRIRRALRRRACSGN